MPSRSGPDPSWSGRWGLEISGADAVRTTGTPAPGAVRYASGPGRWVVAATVLGSGMAFLDATVVNIALPRIGEDLDADIAGLQWIVNAYALTLAGLLLLGGALGDRLGRRRASRRRKQAHGRRGGCPPPLVLALRLRSVRLLHANPVGDAPNQLRQ